DLTAWAQQEMRYKAQMDYESGINTAHDKGVEEGVAYAARGMKAKNLPVDMIVEITGLTPEQVAAL
ncbi:MAG: hypothetical protein IJQ86_09065, partial [Spirochaetia bacterium]|nr:hypothetical protein [Spirochaetia bacterium]